MHCKPKGIALQKLHTDMLFLVIQRLHYDGVLSPACVAIKVLHYDAIERAPQLPRATAQPPAPPPAAAAQPQQQQQQPGMQQ